MPPTLANDAIRTYFRGLLLHDLAALTDADLLTAYVERRDGAAFEALVNRHGAMVWGVCRRGLTGHQDAEDAFQAVFLVLARKAASVAPREMLPNWLHAVAQSTALQARRTQARRVAHEKRFAERPPADPADCSPFDDLRPLLDRELGRLPDRYRVAVVLCDLEGLTRTEAARRLGWPEGTVAGRLARARAMLAARLTRRGVTLSGVPLAALSSADATTAGLPAEILTATVAAVLASTTGSTAGLATGPVAALTHGVIHAMFLTKLKTALAGIALISAACYGVGVALPISANATSQEAPAAKADKPVPVAGNVVRGRVVRDADGVAVAGANVRLLFDETTAVPRPTTRAKADERGEFTFADVPPGKYTLMAFAGGLTSRIEMMRGVRVSVPPAPTAETVVLKMRPGIPLKVRVLSEATGKPIPGAPVNFTWTDLDTELADGNGEIEFPALTKEVWTVEAAAKGYAKVTRAVNLENGEPASIKLKLPPGAAVAGVVRDAEGKPLAGVGANAYSENSGSIPNYVETDAGGRYNFDFLPVGQNITLSLSKREFQSETTPLRLTAGQAEPTRVDVVLKPRPHGGSVVGVVTDAKGKPVAGAELSNPGNSTDEVRRTKTDAVGKYRLENVYPNTVGHEFVVRAEGFAPRQVTFKPGPAAAPSVADVKLEQGHRIRGRVVDPAGKPVREVSVYFADGNSPIGGIGGEGVTDAEGRFDFKSLPAESPFTFTKDGFTEIDRRSLPLDGAEEVVVTMLPQGVILGKVVDAATGKVIPRCTVCITFSPDAKEGEPGGGLTTSRTDPGQMFNSARGEFRLADFPAGMPLQVKVTADGYRKQVLRRVVATVATDAKATEFRLTPEDPTKLVTYRGKLVNSLGAGVGGIELRLIAAGARTEDRTAYPFNWQMVELGQLAQVAGVMQFLSRTTATDGSFEFRGVVPDAEVELVYWGNGVPGGRVDRLDKKPAAERTALVVKAVASATVTGTIDRKAYPEFESIQLIDGTRSFRATLAADGTTFTFADLPPGQYQLLVYGPYHRMEGRHGAVTNEILARQPVTVKVGATKTVTMDSKADPNSPPPTTNPPTLPTAGKKPAPKAPLP